MQFACVADGKLTLPASFYRTTISLYGDDILLCRYLDQDRNREDAGVSVENDKFFLFLCNKRITGVGSIRFFSIKLL